MRKSLHGDAPSHAARPPRREHFPNLAPPTLNVETDDDWPDWTDVPVDLLVGALLDEAGNRVRRQAEGNDVLQ